MNLYKLFALVHLYLSTEDFLSLILGDKTSFYFSPMVILKVTQFDSVLCLLYLGSQI